MLILSAKLYHLSNGSVRISEAPITLIDAVNEYDSGDMQSTACCCWRIFFLFFYHRIIILRTDIFFSARCIIFRLQEMKYLTGILTTRATVHRSFVFCVSLKLSVNYDSKRIWKLKSDLPRDVTFGNYICSLMTYFWIKFIIKGVSGSLRVLRNDNCLWHRLKKKKKWKKFPTTAKQVELETDQRKGRKWKHQINE